MYLCIINPIVLLFLRNLSLPQGVSFAGIGGQLHRNIQCEGYVAAFKIGGHPI